MNMKDNHRKRTAKIIAVLLLAMHCASTLIPAVADDSAMAKATALYRQKKYAESADAFEALIRTASPNPRLYYWAAAANKNCNRIPRAKQLADYVIANFPTSAEASYARQLFPGVAAAKTGDAPLNLPDNLKGKSVDQLMETEEGRKALREALSQQKHTAGNAPATTSGAPHDSSKRKPSGQPFTADAIGADGPNGVTAFLGYGWMESVMDALALQPKGQELLASMIRSPKGDGTYIVKFPSESSEYTINAETLEKSRIKDKALWANLIHCAEQMRYHNSVGQGIEEALKFLTGKHPEQLFPSNTTEQALTQFISEAVKSQSPIVCVSADDPGTSAELVEEGQAYTITAFDSASGMITLRNPHGDNTRRFRLESDPDHKKFEQLNGGYLRMHVSLFPKYFSDLARANL